jgi:hypothetical protein
MSLHTTTDKIKKIIIWFAVGIGVIIFLNLSVAIIKSLIPHKVPPPTVSFGKLPAIPFQQIKQATTPTYTLDTVSGMFPVLPDRVAVYQIAQPQPNLLALNNAKALISTIDYPTPPKALSDVVYQWTGVVSPYKMLTYNILSHDFTLTSSYTTDQNVISAQNLKDEQDAINTSTNFLTNFNAFGTDIDPMKTKTTLYSINGTTQTLQPAISLGTTQVIQVDFFQKDIDTMPIYYPNPAHSLINTLVGSSISNSDVIQAQVMHKSLTKTSGTYPIKSAQEALMELQTASPSAYVAAAPNPPTNSINIRNISLGYYIGENPQQLYLMPIIVLQGDNGFFGYVSAVTDAWIQK